MEKSHNVKKMNNFHINGSQIDQVQNIDRKT